MHLFCLQQLRGMFVLFCFCFCFCCCCCCFLLFFCFVLFFSSCASWTGCTNLKRATAQQNQQNDLCSQRRLRSAWASAQSDQSLRCAFMQRVAKDPRFLHADSEDWLDWADAQADLSSLGAHVILLVLSCCGSNILVWCFYAEFLIARTHRNTEQTKKQDSISLR